MRRCRKIILENRSPNEEKAASVTGPMTGAATAAIPPVATITVCTAKSLKRMQGRNKGDESPHGDRQTTLVPAALSDS